MIGMSIIETRVKLICQIVKCHGYTNRSRRVFPQLVSALSRLRVVEGYPRDASLAGFSFRET